MKMKMKKTALAAFLVVALGAALIPAAPAVAAFAANITKIYNAYRSAGERAEDSLTGTDYTSTSSETKCDTVDTSVNSTTVYAGPAVVSYVYVNTVLSAHTVVLKDDTVAKFTLPASLAAGTEKSPPGAQVRTSLVVDPDDLSTGNVTVCYRPLLARVNW